MARSVTIAAAKKAILLPNGTAYDAGATVILSDAQFVAIKSSLIPGTIIDNGVVVGVEDAVITQASTVAALGAKTAVASVGVPTKIEFDKTVVDLETLFVKVNAILTAIKGSGKPMA